MNTQGNLAYTNFTYNVCRVFFEPHFEEQCRGFCGFGRGVSGSIENNVGVEGAVSNRFQAAGEKQDRFREGGERQEGGQGFRGRAGVHSFSLSLPLSLCVKVI